MSVTPTIKLSYPEPDVALLTLDDPAKGANILSRSVLEELATQLDTLEQRTDLTGLVICSAKPGIFIAGADIREFVAAGGLTKAETIAVATRGRTLFQRLARLPFPSVAAIGGMCVGGGAELAVWCDRRLMADDPKTQIGFPEVKLGLFPGWGGTARTPRIVGLGNAVEMITGGESIDSRTAVAMGLATDVVPGDRLLLAAISLVRAEHKSGDYLRDRERWSQPIAMSATELAFLGATASASIQQQTKGQYPAPLAALNLMLETSRLPTEQACQREVEAFAELFGTPVNRALLNVFFLTDRHKKDAGIVIEDALSANAPHLDDLRQAGLRYLIGVKPGDHAFLFAPLHAADEAGRTQTLTRDEAATGVRHPFRWYHGVPLNESHPDCLVNVLED